MKQFILRGFYFTLLVLSFFSILEIGTRNIPNSYKAKTLFMDTHADSIEWLVLGNSHAYMGIEPDCFPTKGFNLANVSQRLKCDAFLVDKYLPQMPHLNVIILPINYGTVLFTPPFADSDDWSLEINYTLYMNYPSSAVSKCSFETANYQGAFKKCLQYYLQRKDLVQMTSSGRSTSYSLAEKKAAENTGWDSDTGAERVLGHTWNGADSSILTENKYFLKQIATLTSERDIKLVLISMPVRDSYAKGVDKKQMLTKLSIIDSLVCQYSNVSYIDMFTADGFCDDDFFDGDHLTELGAEKFTLMLSDSIQRKLR